MFLKVFTLLTEKHLRCRLFNKFAGLKAGNLLERGSNTGAAFLWILRNFKEHLFWRASANGCSCRPTPVNTQPKLNLHRTFVWLAGLHINLLSTFTLGHVSKGTYCDCETITKSNCSQIINNCYAKNCEDPRNSSLM